jgi:hypothetical protein
MIKESELRITGCRNHEPAVHDINSIPEQVSPETNGIFLDQPEDEAIEPEIELDPEFDPIVPSPTHPDVDWKGQIRSVEVRKPKIPSPEEQKDRISWILGLLDSEKPEPEPWQVEESLNWLSNLESLIPDHNDFVASSFHHFFPAWKELLRGVNRKSARSVLSWLKSGFKPKFAGTEQAKSSKREIVESMLKRVVKPNEIPRMLSGRFCPHSRISESSVALYELELQHGSDIQVSAMGSSRNLG